LISNQLKRVHVIPIS